MKIRAAVVQASPVGFDRGVVIDDPHSASNYGFAVTQSSSEEAAALE